MKKLVLVLVIAIFGCKKEQSSNDKFNKNLYKQISKEAIKIDEKCDILITVENQTSNKINISEVISDFNFLTVSQNDKQLIGGVDKIIFNDNYIFILDRFISESLQMFDKKNGKLLLTLNKYGEAPNEFLSIYDFDIDFNKKQIFLFDGNNSKYLKFNFDGVFLDSKKLPFRIGNIRKLKTNFFINHTNNSPNDHLGEFYSNKDIIIIDSLLIPKFAAFKYNLKLIENDYYNYDYFNLNNSGEITYFPRFKNSIYTLQKFKNKFVFKKTIQFDLGKYNLNEEDFIMDSQTFIKFRRNDNKLFGNGKHFVTTNWIGCVFKDFGGVDLSVFYSKKTKKAFIGKGFNFDFKGLPVFNFPFAVHNNTGVVVLDSNILNGLKNLTVKQKQYFIDKNIWSDEIEKMINSIKDVETPILLFYKFK